MKSQSRVGPWFFNLHEQWFSLREISIRKQRVTVSSGAVRQEILWGETLRDWPYKRENHCLTANTTRGYGKTYSRTSRYWVATQQSAWRTRHTTDSQNKWYVINTYHCVVTTLVTHIQESLVCTLPVLVALTFHGAVRRRPTKVTDTDFRKDTASLEAALRTHWNTSSTRKTEISWIRSRLSFL